MHPNAETHIRKLDASIAWLARWGVCDSTSLCRAATTAGRELGEPSVQARHWPQQLVRKGFAECIELDGAQAGARKIFIATRTGRMHASALGYSLTDPYHFNPAKLSHRLIAQRALLDLAYYVRCRGGYLMSYITESEMAGQSRAEYMERWPDVLAVVGLPVPGDQWEPRKICIEVEWNIRSTVRVQAMGAGLAELLRHPAAMNHQHAALVLVPSPATADRYRRAMAAGTPYTPHERRGLAYVPGAGIAYMPPGIEVVHGWSVPDDVAEQLTHARAHANQLARASISDEEIARAAAEL